jgi:hypothetical protein
MGNYLVSNIEYPASQYEPIAPEVNGVYHEDREVNVSGAVGASQMYRTYNAKFLPASTSWEIGTTGVSDAYATVQNPDGSIHYYWNNGQATWTEWLGSGNNAVYNAVDFGMSPSNPDNTQALQNAIDAAFNAPGTGGTIYIPPGTYKFQGTVALSFSTPPGADHGIVIAGASGDTELEQISFQGLFSFTGLASGRGVRFKDLRMTFNATGSGSLPAAVSVMNSQNITCERVYFYNWPQAVNFGASSQQCGLFNCTIDYASGNADAIMIDLAGSGNWVDNCLLSQTPRGSSGPAGCYGIKVEPFGGDIFITNCHISDFTTGIWVSSSPNLVRLHCSNVVCESWTNALLIRPEVASKQIHQLFFDDCIFAREDDSIDTSSTGVVIDINGGDNTYVSDIFLNNCMCFQWNGPGVQINRGQNIVITGGRYGSNASSMSTSGGIAITGTAANVTINGADCSGQVPNYSQQPYALSITAAATGLYVRGCNLTGGSLGSVYASSAGTQVEITDCAGYNDQGTILQSTTPPPANPIRNTSPWHNLSQGWFGRIAFYITGAGDVSIGNAITQGNTYLTDGGYELSPGEEAIIANAASATHFLAVGK